MVVGRTKGLRSKEKVKVSTARRKAKSHKSLSRVISSRNKPCFSRTKPFLSAAVRAEKLKTSAEKLKTSEGVKQDGSKEREKEGARGEGKGLFGRTVDGSVCWCERLKVRFVCSLDFSRPKKELNCFN